MKFLLVVLMIHFVGEVVMKKNKIELKEDKEKDKKKMTHPAEFQLRSEF